jgi:hypothetical protein
MPTEPPPHPVFDPHKRYRMDPRDRFSTCITHIAEHIIHSTERIRPNLEAPWHISEHDIKDRIQIYLLDDAPGSSYQKEWTDDHLEFTTEHKENPDILFVYSVTCLQQ